MLTAQKINDVMVNDKFTLSPQVQQAIASLHLENITLSNESLADLSLFCQGKLTKEETINRVIARVTRSK